ncbi:MAG: GNAT family N-acetyltransferase [Lachnospiraceae bacterium]|nr:GNAT family N-acetyltransferase [Lachnospiraceae bacterium]
MGLELLQASTADALTITGISRRAFHSDVEVGAEGKTGPPGYMSVPYYTKMARSNHLFKLVDNGLIIGGAVLFPDKEKLNIGRVFIDPENHRKAYGVFMMQEIEALYPAVKEFTLDTPIWNVRTNSFYTKLGYTEVRRDDDFVYYSKKR